MLRVVIIHGCLSVQSKGVSEPSVARIMLLGVVSNAPYPTSASWPLLSLPSIKSPYSHAPNDFPRRPAWNIEPR